MSNLALFTVAICTRNRATFLRSCLDGLLASARTHPLELIVIDNGSTDRTPELLAEYSDKLHAISEPTVGLSHARNCALAECITPYLVFLDDDAIPDPSWVPAIADLLAEETPDVFGGPYRPYYLEPRKPWFPDRLGSAHLDLLPGQQSPMTCFSGGNMGWRTELLRSMGGFDPGLGVVGNQLRLGEETALQLAIWREHPSAKYIFVPDMSMTHYVSPEKMTLRYIHKRNYIYGFQLAEIDPNNNIHRLKTFDILKVGRFGFPLILRIFYRNRPLYPFWKSFAAAYLSLNSIYLGVIARRIDGGVWFLSRYFRP